jgi:hypothetical protein
VSCKMTAQKLKARRSPLPTPSGAAIKYLRENDLPSTYRATVLSTTHKMSTTIKRVWRFPNNRDDRIATADIDFTTCTGRRLSNVLGGPGPDVRVSASAAVFGETQCKFPVIDGGDLCKTCETHRSRGGKYWNGHIYDPPSDTTHMIGSRWAEGNVIWLEPPAAPLPPVDLGAENAALRAALVRAEGHVDTLEAENAALRAALVRAENHVNTLETKVATARAVMDA